jgi:hypothetical protein
MKFASMLCLFFLGMICVSLAATTTFNVNQTVIDEGNGQTGNDGGGGFIVPIDATPPGVYDVRIYAVTQTSAMVSWKTNEPCLAELYYGKTRNFELGPLVAHADSYEDYHEVALSNLEPGMKYYLKIRVQNQKGVRNTVTSYSFYTLPKFLGVPNVGNLAAMQADKTIVLTWENPAADNFRGVQINKNIGYPAWNINEGEKVFSGLMETFVDANIKDKTAYFYTVFSYDDQGHFSSGVITSLTTDFAAAGGEGGQEGPEAGEEEIPEGIPAGVVNLRATKDMEKKIISLSWQCPESSPGCKVEIYRNTGFPSLFPEGDLIYGGSDNRYDDADVAEGVMYFYSVFVKNEKGNYSNARIVAAILEEGISDIDDAIWNNLVFMDIGHNLVLEFSEENAISILAGNTVGVSYGAQDMANNLKAVVMKIQKASYIMEFDDNSQTYKTSFIVPAPVEHLLKIDFIDQNGEIVFEKEITLKVLPPGGIYSMQNERLFAGGLTLGRFLCRAGNLLGGYNEACMQETGVADAEVSIFAKNDDGNLQLWNAYKRNQSNPALSGDNGEYGFSVPNGEYEVWVEKDGFERMKKGVTVGNNVINENIKIYGRRKGKYGILLLIILAVSAGIYFKRRRRKKGAGKR